MNDPELESWQQEWRSSPASHVDIAALAAATQRRNRREKLIALLELAGGIGATAMCLVAITAFNVTTFEKLGFVLLAVVVVAFTWWAYRERRRQWQAVAVAQKELIAHERGRLHRRVRYWRANAWLVLAMWAGLVIGAIAAAYLGSDRAGAWFASAAINLVVLVATVILAIFVRRSALRRERELDRLEGNSEG